MYAIIYFIGDTIHALQSPEKTLLTFKTLKEADKTAEDYEDTLHTPCQVISIDSVHE